MHKSKILSLMLSSAVVLSMAGCGGTPSSTSAKADPTAAPTPSIVPIILSSATATPTPTPEPTPEPPVIGQQTDNAKFIYFSNDLRTDLKELYLRTSGSSDQNWGSNFIPSEASIRPSEKVRLYYGEEDETSASASGDQKASNEDSIYYDIKLVTSDGKAYEIYSVQFSDMEKASLLLAANTATAYLSYVSLSSQKETTTIGNKPQTVTPVPQSSSSDNNTASEDTSYDDSSYDSAPAPSSDTSGSSSDNGDNSGEDTSDAGGGDYSYDDSYDSGGSDYSGSDDTGDNTGYNTGDNTGDNGMDDSFDYFWGLF